MVQVRCERCPQLAPPPPPPPPPPLSTAGRASPLIRVKQQGLESTGTRSSYILKCLSTPEWVNQPQQQR